MERKRRCRVRRKEDRGRKLAFHHRRHCRRSRSHHKDIREGGFTGVVSVDVYGPHCENLTLIDLPGIVRTAGKQESATLAEDIQGLMNDYLSNTRCVILAVLPCNVDFHNSQILAEARKVDPDTKRTIPVLTKPDLIDDGGEMSVKELLLGMKTDSFSLGFHMVKGKPFGGLHCFFSQKC